MSRWTSNFESHGFHDQWKRVKSALAAIQLDDPVVISSLDELGRLKKVCAYVDQVIVGIDPELLPLNFWDFIREQFSSCADQIAAFNSNKNPAHMQNANANLDLALSQMRPYLLGKGKLGPALQAAAKAYSSAMDDAARLVSTQMRAGLQELEANQAKISDLMGKVVADVDKVREKHDDLFVDSPEHDSFSTALDGYIEEISSFHHRLVSGSGDSQSIKEEVAAARETAKSGREAIEKLQRDAESTIRDLTSFETRILGVEKDGKREGGLDAELKFRVGELGDFELHQKTRYEALNRQIEALLPGATSAGLASAYLEMKSSFDGPIRTSSRVFYWSIGVLIVGSVLLCIDEIGFKGGFFITWTHLTDWQSVLKSFAYKLPFYGPAVWLAFYASKRRSEFQRLQQEYAHKEALAKSYDSFKKQAEDLDREDNALLTALLEKAIGAVSYNASQTLDGRHGDKMPLQEALERIAAILAKTKSADV